MLTILSGNLQDSTSMLIVGAGVLIGTPSPPSLISIACNLADLCSIFL